MQLANVLVSTPSSSVMPHTFIMVAFVSLSVACQSWRSIALKIG